MGKEAFHFIDFLSDTKQGVWQVMPLGPTGFGDSPYACFSAFAGNPMLISPEKLNEDGLLSGDDLQDLPDFPRVEVDYGPVIQWKEKLLHKAYSNFMSDQKSLKQEFENFCNENASWLEDFSLFMALKEIFKAPWFEWERDYRLRDKKTLQTVKKDQADLINAHKFYQLIFFRQWNDVKRYANEKAVRIIGDIPIFVAYDSADAWAHSDLFHFDKDGKRTKMAGVPPDYFSETGQLWGNPLYRWDKMEETGFKWWIDRFRTNLKMVDIIRLDHFRGFEACWEVPAGEETAIKGEWVKTPGDKLFKTIRSELGDIPIIAENLGVITPPVEAMRHRFGFPGMKVLQFAFGDDPDSEYLPHNYNSNNVVYSGTHDNDTSVGWYQNSSTQKERDFVRRYCETDGSEINWDLIRLAMFSVCHTAIFPLQDIMGLGSEARMNYPGEARGNWAWRFTWEQVHDYNSERLADQTWLSGRSPEEAEEEGEA